jgi:RNA polymerase sigma factor (sigma-70 family)
LGPHSIVFTSDKSMNATRFTPAADTADDRRAAGALEEAFALYQDELLGTLFYLVGNVEDARDTLQETFLKCWRNRAALGEIENLKAWIFRIALNTGRDLRGAAWRRLRSPMSGDEMMLATDEPGPQSNVEHQEQLMRVRQALGNLRQEEQEVFLLRQNAQMTYDEIARSVGIPLSTVKTRMRLALGKLRAALATP